MRFGLCRGPGRRRPLAGRLPAQPLRVNRWERNGWRVSFRFRGQDAFFPAVRLSSGRAHVLVSAGRWAAPASMQVTRPLPVPGSIPRQDSILSADANIWRQQPLLRPSDPSGSQLLSRCLFIAGKCSLIPAFHFCSPHDVPCGSFSPHACAEHQKQGRFPKTPP